MRSEINQALIEKAITAIKQPTIEAGEVLATTEETIVSVGIADTEGRVPSEFSGYISSFGAAVVQSGLLPAVIFFEDEGANPAEDRPKLIKAIKTMVGRPVTEKLSQAIRDKTVTETAILEAAIALKLALRTFKKQNP